MPRATYKTGSRNDVMRRMAECAICDQRTLIDAWTPPRGKPDEEAAKAIQDAKDLIADFRRIARTIPCSA